MKPERVSDLSEPTNCPVCNTQLPRTVTLPEGEPTTVEIVCPTCGFSVSYYGPGLILDRRKVSDQ